MFLNFNKRKIPLTISIAYGETLDDKKFLCHNETKNPVFKHLKTIKLISCLKPFQIDRKFYIIKINPVETLLFPLKCMLRSIKLQHIYDILGERELNF